MADIEQAESERRDLVRTKLRTQIEVDFQEAPLGEVLKEVGEKANVTILANKLELDLMGIDMEMPVTMSGKMSVREFLRRLPQSLSEQTTYMVREDSIEITSLESADSEPAIRYYDLAFVLPNDSHLDSVTNAIQMSIDPDTWLEVGGTNTIANVGSMLIVTCPETVHQRIESMLARIASMNKQNLEVQSPRRQPAMQPAGGMGGMF